MDGMTRADLQGVIAPLVFMVPMAENVERFSLGGAAL